MESPFKLKLYKKLELYQDLKFQNKKADEADNNVWKTEKRILKWTVNNHHFLREPLSKDVIRKKLLGDGTSDLMEKYAGEYDIHLTKTFENLVARGYAEYVESEDEIKVTPSGLLMGEVVHDVEESWYGILVYELFYWGAWIVVLSASFLVIVQLVKAVKSLFC